MMFLYTIIEAACAVVFGIMIATRAKRAEGLTYGTLDRVGVVTNGVLLAVYACLAPAYMFVAMICEPAYEGILGVLGWVISIFIGSTALACGLGLGYSVALRRRGESKKSFAVQFIGAVYLATALALFAVCYDNILASLN